MGPLNLVLMASGGPSKAMKKNSQLSQMGPLQLLKNVADSVEWAYKSYRDVPAMVLDGPTKATEKCCQWSRMGPSMLQRLPIASDGPGKVMEKYCRWSQMGPFKLLRNVADDVRWAHLRH